MSQPLVDEFQRLITADEYEVGDELLARTLALGLMRRQIPFAYLGGTAFRLPAAAVAFADNYLPPDDIAALGETTCMNG